MAKKDTRETECSKRKNEYESMLKEAQARPGVYDVMQVYQSWQKLDQGLNPYREVIKDREIIAASDHTNIQ